MNSQYKSYVDLLETKKMTWQSFGLMFLLTGEVKNHYSVDYVQKKNTF